MARTRSGARSTRPYTFLPPVLLQNGAIPAIAFLRCSVLPISLPVLSSVFWGVGANRVAPLRLLPGRLFVRRTTPTTITTAESI